MDDRQQTWQNSIPQSPRTNTKHSTHRPGIVSWGIREGRGQPDCPCRRDDQGAQGSGVDSELFWEGAKLVGGPRSGCGLGDCRAGDEPHAASVGSRGLSLGRIRPGLIGRLPRKLWIASPVWDVGSGFGRLPRKLWIVSPRSQALYARGTKPWRSTLFSNPLALGRMES